MAVGTITTETSGSYMTTFQREVGTDGNNNKTYNVYRVSTTKNAKRVTMVSVSVTRVSEPTNAYTEANMKDLHDDIAAVVQAHIDGGSNTNPAF